MIFLVDSMFDRLIKFNVIVLQLKLTLFLIVHIVEGLVLLNILLQLQYFFALFFFNRFAGHFELRLVLSPVKLHQRLYEGALDVALVLERAVYLTAATE